MKKRMIIGGILCLILLAVGSFWLKNKRESKREAIGSASELSQQKLINKKNSQSLERETDTSEWKTHTNNDYQFSFKYPNSWSVNPTPSSDMGGEWFSVSPEKNIDNGKLRFTIAIFKFGHPFKSKNTPDSWYKNNIENPDRIPGYKGETKKLEINGNPAYYVMSPDKSNQAYTISHEDVVIYVLFVNKEIAYDSRGENIEKEWNYSEYLPDFEYFVNSIEFTK